MPPAQLLRTLKQSFGYDAFRPLQEEIITDALAGRDVFALLPTGGGKSLCFQLPALLRPGLTVVVSPLIALMKDQVDALTASGIPATFLNSTLGAEESKRRLRGLHQGEYRLLYMAPERLMLSGFLQTLKSWNVEQIAIDEAHCVSEWGHDFRPEYRQLANLREHFPAAPIMALTATATDRVRADIVEHLRLREPCCYVASFNRPNLHYRVLPKARPYEQALQFIRSRAQECGIIYCASRKATESVAERLSADGILARPYHAGLDAEVRGKHQELFLRDEVRVICATIAFGMGINKPNVRYVLHYDLPKNVEGYYQETGRAGRDGLPGECLLLYSSADAVKQTAFIEEKPDPQEQRIAREQLQQMVHYAEISSCRRASLLAYFSEEYPEPTCGGCDNCLAPRETFDGTLAAQKLLSCVYRVRQATPRFGVGLNHIIEVLTGARTEKLLKWGHDRVSTYGIGKEHSRNEWQSLGRELIRLGLLQQTAEKFSVLEMTEEGLEALRTRRAITLTRPIDTPAAREPRGGDIPCDLALFDRLRQLRKQLADERDVPAYVIFSDVALRLMARDYPTGLSEFARISGVGEKKRVEFGPAFCEEIATFLRDHPRQSFPEAAQPWIGAAPKAVAKETSRESWELFAKGKTVAQVASARGLNSRTVVQHLAEMIATGESCDPRRFFTAEQQAQMEAAFARYGLDRLAPVKEALPASIDYDDLNLCRAIIQARQRSAAATA
ncbi:MAG TPA: DNA helicase RecQ [Chthoniobacteraceae bacterium]|jgi:ATP-dependent DNA helicase RecQ